MSAPGGQVDAGSGLSDRRKRAELTSALGAGVLGAGIGVLLSDVLSPYVIALLAVGLLSHSWGMYEKHRLDSSLTVGAARWATWLYWVCWLLLAGLAGYIVWGLI